MMKSNLRIKSQPLTNPENKCFTEKLKNKRDECKCFPERGHHHTNEVFQGAKKAKIVGTLSVRPIYPLFLTH